MEQHFFNMLLMHFTGCNFCPLRVPNGTRGQNRPLVSFYDILKSPLNLRMRRMGYVKKKVAIFFLKNMSFLAELQSEIIIFIIIVTSCNIPGDSLKIFHQIRSKGFLFIKIMDPSLLFGYQKTVCFFDPKRFKVKYRIYIP